MHNERDDGELSIDWAPAGVACGSGFLRQSFDEEPLSLGHLRPATEFLEQAVEAGVRLVDTADVYGYGKDEKMLGHVLRASPGLRERIFIQTKCGISLSRPFACPPKTHPHYFDLSADHIRASVDGSLARLQTEYIDVLLLHRADPLMNVNEIGQAFETLYRSGKVRNFGVSNFSPSDLELLAGATDRPIIFNQVKFGLGHPALAADQLMFNRTGPHDLPGGAALCSTALSAFARAKVRLQAWSPLYGIKSDDGSPTHSLLASELAAIASKYQLSPMAIAISWIQRLSYGVIPVLGTSRIERLVDCMKAKDNRLEAADWYRLLYASLGLDCSIEML